MSDQDSGLKSAKFELAENEIELAKNFLEVQKQEFTTRVEVQKLELTIRSEEIQSRNKEIDGNLQIAKLNLDIVAEDRKDDRANNQQTLTKNYIFAFAVFFVLTFFLGFAIYSGKEQIALEIIKVIALLVTGGLGGYSIRLNQDRKDNLDISED